MATGFRRGQLCRLMEKSGELKAWGIVVDGRQYHGHLRVFVLLEGVECIVRYWPVRDVLRVRLPARKKR